MYKSKSFKQCAMPAPDEELRVLILNGSLKKGSEPSNTEEVAQMVVDQMKEYNVKEEFVRLADYQLDVGLKFKESDADQWPEIAEKIRNADIIIFATPIWWGGRSSLIQRVMERMDAFDEEYIEEGRSALLNKVAGVVITGSEDGAQAVLASIMEVLTFMNFTLPPQCAAYWVGEMGVDHSTDRERRKKNEAVTEMAKTAARNLIYYAQLLKKHPLTPEE